MPPLNLYARVQPLLRILARETAGAARTRHSLRPLWGVGNARPGRFAPREREAVSNRHFREGGPAAPKLAERLRPP
jgi:hypothetical protein